MVMESLERELSLSCLGKIKETEIRKKNYREMSEIKLKRRGKPSG